jgi:hypothetical protein
MENVVASHPQVSNPDLPLAALFDSQDDPHTHDEVSGPLYHQMPNNIVGFVVLDLVAPTLVTSVSFYMGRFSLYRCPRNYRVFSGTSASGPWTLTGELNSTLNNLPDFTTFKVDAPTISQYLRLEFDSPLNSNAATINLYEITVDAVPPDPLAAVMAIDVGLTTILGGPMTWALLPF